MAHQPEGAPLMLFFYYCFYSFFCKSTNGALARGAPLLVQTSNGAPWQSAPLVCFFCKTTNGAPPEGAPLVTWITNGAFRVGAPLVSGQQQDILDSLSYPHSLSPHFILSTSSLSRVPPLFHLISTIDSFNLSG